MEGCEWYALVGLAACVSPKSSCSEQSSPELRVEPEVEDGVCTHRGLGQDCGDGKQSVGNLIGFAFFSDSTFTVWSHIYIYTWLVGVTPAVSAMEVTAYGSQHIMYEKSWIDFKSKHWLRFLEITHSPSLPRGQWGACPSCCGCWRVLRWVVILASASWELPRDNNLDGA